MRKMRALKSGQVIRFLSTQITQKGILPYGNKLLICSIVVPTDPGIVLAKFCFISLDTLEVIHMRVYLPNLDGQYEIIL